MLFVLILDNPEQAAVLQLTFACIFACRKPAGGWQMIKSIPIHQGGKPHENQ